MAVAGLGERMKTVDRRKFIITVLSSTAIGVVTESLTGCSKPSGVSVRNTTPPAGGRNTASVMEYPDGYRASLIESRLRIFEMHAEVAPEYKGALLPVRVTFENKRISLLSASLQLASENLQPFSPVIPPYVGVAAKSFSARIWIEQARGIRSLQFTIQRRGLGAVSKYVGGAQQWETIKPAKAPPAVVEVLSCSSLNRGHWIPVHIRAANMGSVEHPVTNITLEVVGEPGGSLSLYLADPILSYGNGERYPVLTYAVPMETVGLRVPLASHPIKGLPQRDTLTMGGYSDQLENSGETDQLPLLARFMSERFPDADFVIAPVSDPQPMLAKRWPQLPPSVFYQMQKVLFDNRTLAAIHAMPTNARGEMLDIGWTPIGTDAIVRQGFKAEIEYAASLGINNFKQIDYYWPDVGGELWGYNSASVAAYREDLLQRDGGLDLLPGLGGCSGGKLRFWDYFKAYHGLQLAPADIGITKWQDYRLVSRDLAANGGPQERKNLGVFVALMAYEWLKLAQNLGQWAKNGGGQHDYTTQPDDFGKANDLIYLSRLREAGTAFYEYFNSPHSVQGAYYNMPIYLRAAKIAGKKLGVIGELGLGGNGEPYYDPAVAYLLFYELGAVGFANYHNEFMDEVPSWEEQINPKNRYSYDRTSVWMAGAYGLRRARREGVFRQSAPVISVSMRAPLYNMSSWTWDIAQQDSLAEPLADAHVDFEQVDQIGLPQVLDQATVLFYTPPFSNRSVAKQVQSWLRQGNRTFVTHSYIPINLDTGEALPRIQENRGTFSLLPEFAGLHLGPNGYWNLSKAFPWRVVMGSLKQPLLSELHSGVNNHIFYMHRRPQDTDPNDLKQVIDTLAQLANFPCQASPDHEAGPVIAHGFTAGTLRVMVLWNRKKLAQLGPGDVTSLLPGRGPAEYNPDRRPYPIRAPGTRCGAYVSVDRPGKYLVYRFLKDREEKVVVGDDRWMQLEVRDLLAEQFYFGIDNRETSTSRDALRAFRKEIYPYVKC